MYFAVGGRKVQSGLYRVRYVGDEATAEVDAHDAKEKAARATRQKLEQLHEGSHEDAIEHAWPHLDDGDRIIRYAARTAIEHRPREEWMKKALQETVNTMTTQMLKLKKSKGSSDDDSSDAEDFEKQIAAQARKHYFYEERAAKVDVCIRNDGDMDIENLGVELGCPSLKGFDIADRIHSSPFDKRSDAELKKLGYPEVKNRHGAIIVQTTVDSLAAGETSALFRTPLRLAVGPDALGRKIAMQYVLRDTNGKSIGEGRLKLRLGQKPNGGTADGATHYQSLDDE